MYCFCSFANRVDYERIKDVGPNRAASEWLLRCGATVRYHGQEKWQKDYNHLPTGPLDKYKIQAIDATDSCIMHIGFDHLGTYPVIVLIGHACDSLVVQGGAFSPIQYYQVCSCSVIFLFKD